MTISLHYRGLDKAMRDLRTFKRSAIPFAARDALNATAFEARRVWGDRMKDEFTLRNQYTARVGVQVEKARGTKLDAMKSTVGHIADYMAKQEQGGTVSGPVPGPVAARQRPGVNRTRPVKLPVRTLHAVKGKGRTRKARYASAIAIAKRRGVKHAILGRPGGGKGLFRISGGKRKSKVALVWSVSRGSSRLEANPTLEPTVVAMQSRFPALTHKAVLKQLKRHRVFGY